MLINWAIAIPMAVVLIVWALSGGGWFFPAWPLLIVGFCLVRRANGSGRLYAEPPGRGRGEEIRV